MPTPIETNTATMQALLEKIAGKAAGGGGGAVETCTVSYNDGGFGLRVIYIKADYTSVMLTDEGGAYEPTDVTKGSHFLVFLSEAPDYSISGACELVSIVDMPWGEMLATFKITGDCTIWG